MIELDEEIQVADIHNGTTYYTKHGKTFKQATGITLKFHNHDGEMSVGYVVGGKEYDTLYIKDEDGKAMIDALDEEDGEWVTASLYSELFCPTSGATDYSRFSLVEDGERPRLELTSFLADGKISQVTYVLPEGDYDVTLNSEYGYLGLFFKLGHTTETLGFNSKEDAMFFNEFTADGERHPALAEKICPTKEQREIAVKALNTLFDTLKENGLMLVNFRSDGNIIGIAKDIPVEWSDVNDVEDESKIIPIVAIPKTDCRIGVSFYEGDYVLHFPESNK